VDFAVQYRYEAFDEPLCIDRVANVSRVAAFLELVAERITVLD